MPGGDGTGPLGKGPGTGANRGKCVSPANNGRPLDQRRGGRCGSLRPGFGGQGGGRGGIQPINQDKS